MWFKNLQLYRFSKPFELSAEDLEAQLEQHPFKPCGSQELSSYGWVPPLGRHGSQLVHATNGYYLLCARKQEKVLPAAVVREVVEEKVEEIESQQSRPVRRKEKESIREEVMLDMLPRAFTHSRITYAYISPKEGLLVVDASSPSRAEELLGHLRQSLLSLPVVPLTVNISPASVMTQWVSGAQVPADFVLEDACELRDPDAQGGIVRCQRQDLSADEIQEHIKAGKQVVKLAVCWDETLSCVLGEDLSIKRLRFSDVMQEKRDQTSTEDAATRLDADFALMTLEFSRFVPRLLDIFGGENVDALGVLP